MGLIMTIKYWDCILCGNTGAYHRAVINREYYVTMQDPLFLSSVPSYEIEQIYCNCDWGIQRQVLENRMSHPEYENPLAKMTDEELLTYLDVVARIDEERQKLVDSEFNV